MDLNLIKQTFILEAGELLEAMEGVLLAGEGNPGRPESVNAMFRAVHTIKGSAGLFGLDAIVAFAHGVESLLDRLRSGELALSGDGVALLLECHDQLAALVSEAESGGDEDPSLRARSEALLERLGARLARSGNPQPLPSQECAAGLEDAEGMAAWHLSVRFSPDVFRNGMDPASFLRYLATLGTFRHLEMIFQHLPAGASFDPELCYLGFELDLASQADHRTLEDVFEFVREGSRIRILPPHAQVEAYLQLIRELPDEAPHLGEILVAGGCLTRRDLEQAPERGRLEARRPGTLVLEDQPASLPVAAPAWEPQRRSSEHPSLELKVIKVQASKLDRLVDLVGELVIAGTAAGILSEQTKNGRLLEASATVNKLVEEIRDNALSLRMVQIGETFNRFRRVVRDVSQAVGKSIELEIHGSETELDKSIVEKLNDPLVHIIRNAIDHGIEPLEVRRSRGKPERGSLALNAYHESGSIVIEVSDDGGGLDRARILAKAVERGLVAPGATLSDPAITELIFEPGFSTAQALSNLSGRGVGMDVVRRSIEELRGSIEVESFEGAGTTLRIRLPLTLAIIDGFRVTVESTSFVIPLDMVIECLELEPYLESERNHLINLRGEVLPFLRLREVFHLGGEPPAREHVVVVQHGEIRAGFVVDRLMGEFQTVIKPLGSLFQNTRGLGGSTILGSGEVALIVDVPELVQLAGRTCRPPAPALLH